MSRKKKEERKTQKGKFKNKLCFLAAAVAAGTITTEDKKLYGGNVCTVRVTGVTTGNPTTLGSAPGTDAIACGDAAIANGMSAIATGKGSFTGYNKAVAIGENATALRESDVAIGAGAGLYNQGLNAKTLPNTASKTRGYNVIIGANAMVGDDNNTSVHTSQGIAIGGSGTTRDAGARKYGDSGGAWAKGDQSIAIGGDTIAEGHSSIAIGGDDLQKAAAKSVTYTLGSGSKTASLSTAMSDLAGVAPGDITSFNATKSGSGAVALGVKSISGDLSLAIGTMSKANKVNATAVGTGAVADLDNSVAIGGGATTANATGTQETSVTINGVTYNNFAGGSGTKVGDVVSIGKNGTFNRQIKNVAAGNISATSTDAINGSQLYSVAQTLQDRFKYVSINSTETGNADNKGALATNSIAIGPNASATVTSENAVVVGNGAKTTEQVMNSGAPTQWTKTGKNSVVIGNKASTNSEGSVAIGHEAKVDNTTNNSGSTIGRYKNDDNSTYMGTSLAQNNIYADPSYVGTQGIAIGANSYSDYQGMSMGVGARSKNLSLALGYFSNAEGTSSIATGVGAYAKGDNSISSGRQSSTISTGSVALGVAARGGSTADGGLGGSIAVGAASDATHEQAIAIGGITNANTATLEQGRGDNTQATAARATAIGANAKAQAESSIAFGTKASVGSAGTNAVAIGKDSSATVANGVALGSESKATTAAGVTGFDMADGRSNVYSGLAGTAKTANMAAVSVGDGANKTRQITGVAAGKEDTDAVNVAQLKSTNLKIAGNTTSGGADVRLHDQTLTVKGDGTYLTSTAAGNTITMELKQDVKDKIDNAATKKLDNLDPAGVQKIKDTAAWNVVANAGTPENVKGGDTVKFINGDNIQITQTGKDFTFATKKDVTFDSVTINNGPKLSSTGIDAGGKTISNVANGTANSDAVNLGQLNAAINNVAAGTLSTEKVVASTAADNIATVAPSTGQNLGDKNATYEVSVSKTAVQNIAKDAAAWNVATNGGTAEKVEGGDTVNFVNGDNIEVTNTGKNITIATKRDATFDSVTINNGPKLSSTGVDAGNKKITNVADGTVGAGSKDAVNGGQLHDVKTSVTNNTTALNNLKSNTIKLSGDSTSTTAERLDKNGGIEFGVKSGDTHYLTSTATGTDITLDLAPDAKAKINKVATLSSNTISLGGDNGTTNTQALDKTGGIKFNVKGDGTYLTSNATGDDVKLDLTQATKDKINNAATNKLDNLDPAGVQKIKDTAAWNVVANAGTAEKVQGGDTVKFINGNNIEVTQAGKDFTFATKKDVTFDSVTINNGPKLSSTGIDAGNKTISNVANGTANNDAVNLGQLNNAINNATTTATSTEKVVASTAADNIATVAPSTGQNLGDKNATYEVSVSKTAVQNIAKDAAAWNVSTNGGTAEKVEGGDTVNFVNGDNIEVTNTGKDITIATKRDVNFDSVTVPAGAGNVVINNSGINAGNNKITNVADGTVAAGSKDAVNGGQLHDVKTSVTNNTTALNDLKSNTIKLSGDSTSTTAERLDKNGGIEFGVKSGDTNYLTSTAAGTDITLDLAQAAKDKINNAATNKLDNLDPTGVQKIKDTAAWNVVANAGTAEKVQGGDTVKFINGDNIEVTQAGKDFTFATKKDVTFDSVTINNGPKLSSTGIDAGNKKISNLADGTANNDAVNLGQLNTAINNATATATSTEKVVASTAADNIATVAPSTGQNLGDKNATYEVSVSKTAVQNIAKDAAAWNVSTNGGTAEKVEGGDTVNFVNGDNIEVTNTGKDITIATKKDATFDSVTINNGPKLSSTGVDAGNKKITNVADGTVAAGSKDAVNGGQLHDVKTSVTNNTTALNNLKNNTISLGGDTGTTNTQALDKTGGIKFNVKGDGTYLTSNATNDDVTLDLTQATKDKINNAATNKLDNLDPTGVQKIKDTAAWNVVANAGTAEKVQGGDTVKFIDGDNIEITQAGKDFTFATKKDVTFDSVTINNGPKLSSTGIDAGNKKISNLADGTANNDAVNLGQLNTAINNAGAAATIKYKANGGTAETVRLSDGLDFVNGSNTTATVGPNGVVKYDVNLGTLAVGADGKAGADGKTGADGTVGKDGIATTQDVAKAINSSAWKVTSTASTGTVNTPSVEDVKNGDTVKFDAGDNIEITQNGKDFTFATKKDVTFDSVTINNGGPKLSATGIDAANKKITNVANGDVTATSKDAVNGSQLYGLSKNTVTVSGDSTSTTPQTLDQTGGIKLGIKSGDTNFLTSTATGTDVTLDLTQATKDKINKVTTLSSNTISLGGDTGTTNTQSLDKTGGIKFNVKGDGTYLTSSATGDDVTLDLTQTTKDKINNAATNKLDNLDPTGVQKIKDTAAWNVVANAGTAEKVQGGDTVKFINGDNIEVTQAGKDFTFATKKDVTFDSVTINNGPKLSSTGIDAGNKKISNVANGTANNDAVNLGQLNNAINNATTTATSTEKVVASTAADNIATVAPSTGQNLGDKNATYEVSVSKTAVQNIAKDAAAWNVSTNGGTAEKVEGGDTVNFVNGDNIEVTNTGKDITIATKKDATFDSVTINNGPKLSSTGVDAGNKKITNVADGTVGAGSKDAVNGGQLHDVKTSVTNNTNALNDLKSNTIKLSGDSTSTTAERLDKNGGIEFGVKSGDTNYLTSTATGTDITLDLTSDTKAKIDKVTTLSNNTISLGGDTGTTNTQSLDKTGGIKFNVKGDGTYLTSNATNDDVTLDLTQATKDKINNAATNKLDNLDPAGIQKIKDTAAWNVVANNGTAEKVEGGNTVKFIDGDNIAITQAGKDFTIATKRDVNFDSVTVPAGAGNVVINNSGINAGNNKITNVADGTIAPGSKDAVNGGQLHDVQNTINAGAFTVSANGGAKDRIAKDENIDFENADGNIAISYDATGNKFTYNLSPNLNLGPAGSLRIGDALLNNGGLTIVNGPSITSAGVDAGNKKITNVADGTIGAGSKDAINGGQLHDVQTNLQTSINNNAQNIANNTNAINNLNAAVNNPITFTGDSGNNIDRKLGETLNIKGGATGNLTSGNIGVEADSTTNTLNVKLAENIDLGTNGSVKMGDTKINDNGLTINGGPSVTKAGIDAGNKKVTNVANGDITATSKDAVNGSQLHGVADSIKNSIGGNTILNPDGTITTNNIGGTGHNNIHDAIASVNNAANQRTTVVAGDNIDVTVSTNATGGNEYTVATKRDIVVDSVSVANNGPSMNSNGINAGGKTISNLGAGVNPNDAVNVAQLDAVKNSPITFGADTGTDHAATLGSRVSITGDNKNITTSISGNNIQVAMSETPSFGTVNVNDANTGTITGASNVTLDNLDEDGTVGRVATEAQLAAVRNEVAGTKDIDNKLRGFKRGADAGTASAMAMAGIPQVINPGENAIGASISAYKQQTAVAVGYTRASKNGRAVLKISGSVNSNSELGFSLGFMKGWD